MSVIAICGLPGKGKTLFTTYLMKKKYKRENNIFKRIFSKKRFINIFSNYPIQLEKNVYSYKISLKDFELFKKQIPDSFIVLDEFQSYFDSLDYKLFPRKISNNFQFHRHFGIKDIYIISQHPSRIVKQARILVNEFYNIVNFIKIPFTGLAFLRYNIYYNFEDFGKSVNVDKKECIYDFKKRFKIFRYKKIFKSYDTKYMKALVEDKPYIRTDMYNNKLMNYNDILNNFNIDV